MKLTISETDIYYYHPDHLGSASWITNAGGQAIQHLQYLPFGETRVDQRTTSWSTRYSFSAKEKDEESGYSYFGARYYDSELSIWLSVDPLAHKYPSLSPYNYCANNPVKLIDPNGMEVIIGGEEARAYFAEVKKGAKALGISVKMDKNGMLSAKYKGKGEISKDGQLLMDAINSKNVTVNINATKSDYVGDDHFVGGAFMGNELNSCGDPSKGINTYQTVNPLDLKQMDNFFGSPGKTSIHEITESYVGGLISLENGVASGNSREANSVYQTAHNAATPMSGIIGVYGFAPDGSTRVSSNPYSVTYTAEKSNTNYVIMKNVLNKRYKPK